MGHLFQVRAVDVAGVHLHVDRFDQSLCEQVLVMPDLLVGLRAGCPEHQHFPVRGKERAPVVSESRCNLPLVAPIQVHRPQLQVPAPGAREHDLVPLRGNRRFGVVPDGIGKLFQDLSLRACQVDVVGIVHRPEVFALDVGYRRTIPAGLVGGGI